MSFMWLKQPLSNQLQMTLHYKDVIADSGLVSINCVSCEACTGKWISHIGVFSGKVVYAHMCLLKLDSHNIIMLCMYIQYNGYLWWALKWFSLAEFKFGNLIAAHMLLLVTLILNCQNQLPNIVLTLTLTNVSLYLVDFLFVSCTH